MLGNTGSRADRDAGGGPAGALGGRPATSCRARTWAARCCACASSCSSGSTSGPTAQREKERVERMLRALFAHYAERADDPQRECVDYLAGMTDRFAVRTFAELSVPRVLASTPATVDRAGQGRHRHGRPGRRPDRAAARRAEPVGLCPFHEERTPSFSVNAEKKVYYCFGCEASGDAIGFVMETEALDFPAPWSSWPTATGSSSSARARTPRPSAAAAPRAAARAAGAGRRSSTPPTCGRPTRPPPPREHLLGRGLGEETLRAFRVGFAPGGGGPADVGAAARRLRRRGGGGRRARRAGGGGTVSRPLSRAHHLPADRRAAAGCSASGRGRCARASGPST